MQQVEGEPAGGADSVEDDGLFVLFRLERFEECVDRVVFQLRFEFGVLGEHIAERLVRLVEYADDRRCRVEVPERGNAGELLGAVVLVVELFDVLFPQRLLVRLGGRFADADKFDPQVRGDLTGAPLLYFPDRLVEAFPKRDAGHFIRGRVDGALDALDGF